MDREAHREAYAHLVAQMQAGCSWHEAATCAMFRTTIDGAIKDTMATLWQAAVPGDRSAPLFVKVPEAFRELMPDGQDGENVEWEKQALEEALALDGSVDSSVRCCDRLRAHCSSLRFSSG